MRSFHFILIFILASSFIGSVYLGEVYKYFGIRDDTALHVLGFAFLGVAAFFYFRSLIAAIAACTVFAAILEGTQFFLPRNAEIIDFLLHVLSAAAGSLGACIFRHKDSYH